MGKKLAKSLKKLNVVIASHIFATGPALDLEEYLLGKVKTLLFIGHPFAYRRDVDSFKRFYRTGKLKEEGKLVLGRLPGPVFYIRDFLLTLFWVIFQKEKIDLFIGSDNFLAYTGLILKRLGKVENVILYTIDYVPKRFVNKGLNRLYHYFDKQCLKGCKAIWNVSAAITKARGSSRPQLIVPLGVWYDRIPKLSSDQKEKNTIVFMGHLLEKQGLDEVIKAIPKIKSAVPDVRLKIVGTGSYRGELERLAKKLGLSREVKFLGYIENHKDVEKILSRATVAVATYKPDRESFTYFADPGKIKNYLAAGLPVFLTSVPPIAKTLAKEKCGIICGYNSEDISRKIVGFLSDRKLLQLYSAKATAFAKQFDWNKVFERALNTSLVLS